MFSRWLTAFGVVRQNPFGTAMELTDSHRTSKRRKSCDTTKKIGSVRKLGSRMKPAKDDYIESTKHLPAGPKSIGDMLVVQWVVMFE